MMHIQSRDVSIQSAAADLNDFSGLVRKCLPSQGCVEIQHDAKGKEHAWHQHDTDETIIVLDGSLLFYWEEGEAVCKAGDVIQLPRGVKHGSKAAFGPVQYLITFEDVRLAAAA